MVLATGSKATFNTVQELATASKDLKQQENTGNKEQALAMMRNRVQELVTASTHSNP